MGGGEGGVKWVSVKGVSEGGEEGEGEGGRVKKGG